MSHQLKKTLGPIMLWGLGVGYVISGMYFGWNLGLPEGGPYGLLAALVLVSILYITFVLSYAELSCAIPKAGGAFVYGNRALGSNLGFLAGAAQCIEFVFAPPAIAFAIGAYFNNLYPQFHPLTVAFVSYALFTALNIYGVKHSAIFELFITILAVVELLIFAGVTFPSFSWQSFSSNPLPHGWTGILPAIPFAIWFYLAIEGIANVAEETKNPQKDLPKGFGWAMFTLVALAVLVFFASIGVHGWEAIVYKTPGSQETSDSPLPLALGAVFGQNNILYHLLIYIGIFGLLASFHGIILVAGRAIFEFGRVGYAPKILGTTLKNRKTPAAALLVNLVLGGIALLTGKTGDIITISVFGALTLYLLSTISLLRLRQKEPNLPRPYKVPFYPFTPILSLLLSAFCLGAMIYYNQKLALIYGAILAAGFGWFYLRVPHEIRKREFHLIPEEGLISEESLEDELPATV